MVQISVPEPVSHRYCSFLYPSVTLQSFRARGDTEAIVVAQPHSDSDDLEPQLRAISISAYADPFSIVANEHRLQDEDVCCQAYLVLAGF